MCTGWRIFPYRMGKRVGNGSSDGGRSGAGLRIFWGVIERRLTLDYLMDCYSRVPVKKLQPAVREILRSGLYQLLFMERIPASAAVNESVKLTRSMKVGQASGFVNAVLRAVSRQGMSRIEALPEGDEKTELLYSAPGS